MEDIENHHHILAGLGYPMHIGCIHEPKVGMGNVLSFQCQINHLGHQVDPHVTFRLQAGEQNSAVSRATAHFEYVEALAAEPEPAQYGELNLPLEKTPQETIHRSEFSIAASSHFLPTIHNLSGFGFNTSITNWMRPLIPAPIPVL
ncbi:MAG: hypothetical protein ABR915_12115 [Thermoguttaceae bacterium]|jgi:hypothetical protein